VSCKPICNSTRNFTWMVFLPNFPTVTCPNKLLEFY
jgi:hypothetical protein